MPSFKSLCPREVRLIESQFLTLTGRHYKIPIWPGTTESFGAGGEVTSSNQDSKNNVSTSVAKLKLKLKLCSDSLSDDTQGESTLTLCISVAHASGS